MGAVGGSIESVSLNGRNFAVAADAEAQRKLGGFENEVMANGDGTARLIKTRVPLSLDGLTVEVDDDRGDQEFLHDLTDINVRTRRVQCIRLQLRSPESFRQVVKVLRRR
jgi:hypothetical protein